MSTFTPSIYQRALFDYIADPTGGSAVVIAVAGSGKTTSMIEALELIPSDQKVRFFAFNKAIAEELSRRIPPRLKHVTAGTFHSSGYRALLSHFGVKSVETNGRKIFQLIRQELSWNERAKYESFVAKLISLGKSAGIGLACGPSDTPRAWQELIDHHDLFLDDRQASEAEAIALTQQIFQLSIAKAEDEMLIDFDDQLYLPIYWNLALARHRWVLVDEAQDTNALRREFIAKSLEEGGRVVAVGDPGQAIYGFSGASHDAIDLIRDRWHCKELPLSVCYRCPTAVIEKAREIVPQIEPAPGAQAGVVDRISELDALKLFSAADAILCRNTAPLIDFAYTALSRGVPVQILGRDIGKGLIQLLDKMKAGDLEDLDTKLRNYRDRECRKLRAKDLEAKAEAIADRVDGLLAIIDHLPEDQQSLEGLRSTIDRLFGDDESSPAGKLTLSTVHKAKGREWPRVGVLAPELMPAPWARQSWQQQQERNLMYVAWTRAREGLFFLHG